MKADAGRIHRQQLRFQIRDAFGNRKNDIISEMAQSAAKEIINWNAYTLVDLTSFVDLIDRVEQKQPPQPYDFQLRDFYFTNRLKTNNHKELNVSFIERAAELVKNYVSFNQVAYFQSLSFDLHLQKHRFWNKIYSLPSKTEGDHDSKIQVRNVVWTYRFMPLFVFMLAAATLLKYSGIIKMSRKNQSVAWLTGLFVCDFVIRYRKSSEIFYYVKQLESADLEEERLEIINKCIVLDAKINQIEIRSDTESELLVAARNTHDLAEKKIIMEAIGYQVIDRVDIIC